MGVLCFCFSLSAVKLDNLCVVLLRAGLQAMAEEDALRSKRHEPDDDAAGEKNHFAVADVADCGSRRKRG